MKAVFVHQQIESRVEVPKEILQQGDQVSCRFVLKNHSSQAQKLTNLGLELAQAALKDVKDHKPDCFCSIARHELPSELELAAGAQQAFDRNFELAKDCLVSDKTQTLFIRFGCSAGQSDTQPQTNGPQLTDHLQLAVEPHAHVQLVFRILETVFQFVLKSQRNSKAGFEAKLKPSSSKRYSMVEELLLLPRFDGETLHLIFNFKVKKFNTASSTVGVKKGQTIVGKQICERDFVSAGYIDHAKIEALIGAALDEVALGI